MMTNSDKIYMVAVNKVVFAILTIFFIIFYFFILPLPKLIYKYESYVEKKFNLEYIKEQNKNLERYIAELDSGNIESLKCLINLKDENEIYVKFPEQDICIKKYIVPEKTIYVLLYYLFGIMIFSIILINLILSDDLVYVTNKNKKRSKFYFNENQ